MTQMSVPDARKVQEVNYEVQPQRVTIERSIDPNRWNIDCYDLSVKYQYPGKFIIFNHFKFATQFENLPERYGTYKDVERLEKTFKHLGFQEATECQNDLEFDDIVIKIKEVLDQPFDDFGSIIVVILTHGDLRQLYAHDQQYSTDEIRNLFVEKDVAKKLAGKPKIFIIQACQGDKADDGVEVPTEGEVGGGGGSWEKEDEAGIAIPIMADFLHAFSSASGFFSFRQDNGSWFIQTLCDAIDACSKTTDLENILTLVKYDIAYNKSSYNPKNSQYHKKKQIPEVTSTFTKKLYLTREAKHNQFLPDNHEKVPLVRDSEENRPDSGIMSVPQHTSPKEQAKAVSFDTAVTPPSSTTRQCNSCFGEHVKDLMILILICIIATFIGTWYMFMESHPEYHFHCYSAYENSTEGNVHIHPI